MDTLLEALVQKPNIHQKKSKYESCNKKKVHCEPHIVLDKSPAPCEIKQHHNSLCDCIMQIQHINKKLTNLEQQVKNIDVNKTSVVSIESHEEKSLFELENNKNTSSSVEISIEENYYILNCGCKFKDILDYFVPSKHREECSLRYPSVLQEHHTIFGISDLFKYDCNGRKLDPSMTPFTYRPNYNQGCVEGMGILYHTLPPAKKGKEWNPQTPVIIQTVLPGNYTPFGKMYLTLNIIIPLEKCHNICDKNIKFLIRIASLLNCQSKNCCGEDIQYECYTPRSESNRACGCNSNNRSMENNVIVTPNNLDGNSSSTQYISIYDNDYHYNKCKAKCDDKVDLEIETQTYKIRKLETKTKAGVVHYVIQIPIPECEHIKSFYPGSLLSIFISRLNTKNNVESDIGIVSAMLSYATMDILSPSDICQGLEECMNNYSKEEKNIIEGVIQRLKNYK